ncbi:Rab2a [Hexamita inflata]|uniref:Rab2a n=1 Tax=Hexamita inflata TaxID=28002 RepID=A0AA86QV68_9EUKA|nr:Rab2a [Hexamita inflata]
MFNDIKLAIIGDAFVGKTCIATRYVNDIFIQNTNCTTGNQFKRKIIQIEDKQIKFQIWDTAGQEKFRSLAYLYYRSAIAVVLVFDVTNRETFNNLHYWIKEVKAKGDENAIIVIVGNKIDSQIREVAYNEAYQYASIQCVQYFETSALTGEGIDQVFTYLAKQCLSISLRTKDIKSCVHKQTLIIQRGCCW